MIMAAFQPLQGLKDSLFLPNRSGNNESAPYTTSISLKETGGTD